jgi:hypothetical protein
VYYQTTHKVRGQANNTYMAVEKLRWSGSSLNKMEFMVTKYTVPHPMGYYGPTVWSGRMKASLHSKSFRKSRNVLVHSQGLTPASLTATTL